MPSLRLVFATLCGALLAGALGTQSAAAAPPGPYDPELARTLGADEHGMRSYVLVILKTGPTPVPAGPERDAMFEDHFANIARLVGAGKLALAGPFADAGGWRGLFIFAVPDVEEAQRLVATDPVIRTGEMVAEYHRYYGSAALMLVNDAHPRVAKHPF